MRARGWLLLFALAASCAAQAAWAKDTGFEEKRFELTPFGGWTLFDKELTFSSGQSLKNSAYIGGRVGLHLGSLLWLEAAGGTSSTKPDAGGDDVTWYHLSGNLLMSPSVRPISPFVSVGGGWSTLNHTVLSDTSGGTFEIAGGFRVHLSDAIGLRLEARNVLLIPKGHIESAHINDIVLGAGLSFGFGGGRLRDSDGDGVPDRRDKCPDTPRGCTVDANGCPTDSDGDGVCDGLDKCPNTPKGAKVDAQGCPIDSDGDGVYDGLDQCPNTPTGCKVDARGCPIDSDGDGVCDGLDNCPNTLSGCQVDAHGCPIDSDGDGVCDGLDKCPNTAAGLRVDKDGCPIEVMERETELLNTGMIRISNVNFDYNKATIRPEAFAVLDTVGTVLARWPGLKIEIDGHTDSRGRAAYNLALSQRRAESVRAYLLEHFPQLQADQLTVKGYGKSRPLVPNTSQANMQVNRRVEFVVLNKQQLKREIERRRMLKQGEGAPPDTTKH